MSVYTQYGVGSMSSNDIVANESYSGLEGVFKMIEESSQNEHAIFEAIIAQDFAETYHKTNPSIVSESQLDSILESTSGGVWDRVLNFVISIGEKIKGIIKNLLDKIQSVFITDGKVLVSKFEKQINTKFNQGAYDKMKFNYAKPTGKETGKTFESAIAGSKAQVKMKESLNKGGSISGSGSTDETLYDKEIHTLVTQFTDEDKVDLLEDMLACTVGESNLVTMKEYSKVFDKFYFDDVEEVEGYTKALNAEIVEQLKSAKKAIKTVNDNKSATDKSISNIKKTVKDIQNKYTKSLKNGNVKLAAARTNAVAGQVSTLLGVYSKASGAYYGALGSAIKKDLKQSRAIYVKAATYMPRKSIEDQSILLTAVAEASDYEVDCMFEI